MGRRQDYDNEHFELSEASVYKRKHILKNPEQDSGIETPPAEVGDEPDESIEAEHQKPQKQVHVHIVWKNVLGILLMHIGAGYGMYLLYAKIMWKTFIWMHIVGSMSAMGITAGAHRLWAHKTYKAKFPLRFLLLMFNCTAGQNSVIEWSRDHRVHHKFTETDADPHNSRRGFFFSHMGWLMCKKHEDVKTKGAKVSVADLEADPWLAFQHKYYLPLSAIFLIIMPTYIPYLCWNEPLVWSFFAAGLMRYVVSLHFAWSINSITHLYGHRPYDKRIGPVQNVWAAILTMGEAFHNYHHKFPRDYRASEYPASWFNPTKAFIDFFAWVGWAYDLQVTTSEAIIRTKLRHGDGTD